MNKVSTNSSQTLETGAGRIGAIFSNLYESDTDKTKVFCYKRWDVSSQKLARQLIPKSGSAISILTVTSLNFAFQQPYKCPGVLYVAAFLFKTFSQIKLELTRSMQSNYYKFW